MTLYGITKDEGSPGGSYEKREHLVSNQPGQALLDEDSDYDVPLAELAKKYRGQWTKYSDRVPQYNTKTNRILSGRAAPKRKNLNKYHQLNMHMKNLGDSHHAPKEQLKAPASKDDLETVPMWNTISGSKITGNSAPQRRNVEQYLKDYPEREVYLYQDQELERPELWRMYTESGERVLLSNGRLFLYNNQTKKFIGGNCVPLFNKTEQYLKEHPEAVVRPKRKGLMPGDKELINKTTANAGNNENAEKTGKAKKTRKSRKRSSLEKDLKNSSENDEEENKLLSTLNDLEFDTEASKLSYGTGPHDNLFDVPLSLQDEYPSPRNSFDESHLNVASPESDPDDAWW